MIIIHRVKCKYCGQTFDRDKIPCKQISNTRYAHLECANIAEQNKSKEQKDKEELESYIKLLLHESTISPRVRKQLELYKNEYNYSYSGIRKALIYFYEVKGNDKSKANGGIGIVPYCYKQAYDYYYSLWKAKTINQDKDINEYVPKERIVKISPPVRKTKRRKLFSFLDKEEETHE